MMSVPCEAYQRYLKLRFTPFGPPELARRTEQIVCRGDSRKYTKFYCTRVYGGIATGYSCGCCLRCIFCCLNWSRDFPEKYGVFWLLVQAIYQASLDCLQGTQEHLDKRTEQLVLRFDSIPV